MPYFNGRLPASALGQIPGGRLRKDAAAAWNAMCADAARRGFPVPRPTSSRVAYRTLGEQQMFWNLYVSGRGNLAARPGTSNHGWGIAVDVATPAMRQTIDRIGAKYGWSKAWSDAPSEWWHLRFDPSHVTASVAAARPLRRGSTGERVKALQRRLRALGFRSVPAPGRRGYGYLGLGTASAVRRFQKAHKLTADGVCGASTTNALKRAVT